MSLDYVYRKGLIDFNYSYSTAVGLFNSIINFAFLLFANTLSRKLKMKPAYGEWSDGVLFRVLDKRNYYQLNDLLFRFFNTLFMCFISVIMLYPFACHLRLNQ